MTQVATIPVPAPIKDEENPQCQHYWVIQPAMGPESQGICQTCGETRHFKNYVEGASWSDSRLSNRSNTQEVADVSRVVGDQAGYETEE
jgi:hypothetical protein